MREIITIQEDEEYLRQVSTEIDFDNDDYMSYINELKDYCVNNEIYALSPVQIGIPKRVVYIKNTNQDMSNNSKEGYDEEIILINPKIIKMEGHTRFFEACQSCFPYCAVIDRPYSIEVEYYDINQNKKIEKFEGFKSTVFSHEYDHLNGILHIDRAKDIMELSFDAIRQYRIDHPYEIIRKDGEFIYEKGIN